MKFIKEEPIKKTYKIGQILMLLGLMVVIASAVDFLFLNDDIPWWITVLAFIAVPVGAALAAEVTHIKEYDYDEVSES